MRSILPWLDWTGETVVIVASGPSAVEAWLPAALGRAKVVVINNSCRLAPWADLLYACDRRWWIHNPGARGFAGLRVSAELEDEKVRRIRLTKGRDEILVDEPGVLGWGGNSGFHAVNLAVQAGAARLVLVGFDYNGRRGPHWHGRHPDGLNNPTEQLLARWAETLDRQAPRLAELGVDVINLSPCSALQAFPVALSLEAALAWPIPEVA